VINLSFCIGNIYLTQLISLASATHGIHNGSSPWRRISTRHLEQRADLLPIPLTDPNQDYHYQPTNLHTRPLHPRPGSHLRSREPAVPITPSRQPFSQPAQPNDLTVQRGRKSGAWEATWTGVRATLPPICASTCSHLGRGGCRIGVAAVLRRVVIDGAAVRCWVRSGGLGCVEIGGGRRCVAPWDGVHDEGTDG
jgi:hypothetical protein